MKRSRLLVSLIVFVFIMSVSAGMVYAKPKQISIFTSLAGSSWYGIGAGMAKIFADKGVPANAELGAALSNIMNVVNGKGEIGYTMSAAVSMAEAGDPPFKNKVKGISGLIGLSSSYLHIVTPKARNIMTVPELKGRRFVTQPSGAITAEIMKRTLEAYGLKESDLQMSRGSLSIQLEHMKDRRADGMVTVATFPTGFLMELSNIIPVRMLSVSDEVFAKLSAGMPALSRAIIPANTYKGQDEDVRTLKTKMIGVVSDNMPEEDAYWITKELVENIDVVRGLHSAYKNLTPKDFASIPGVKIHPGAAKYYREIGAMK